MDKIIYASNIKAFWDPDTKKEFLVKGAHVTKNQFDKMVDDGYSAKEIANACPAGFGFEGIIDVLLSDVRDLKKKIHKLEDELVDKMLLVDNGRNEDNSG